MAAMDRLHPEGLSRPQLRYALGVKRFVQLARQSNNCMLCMRKGVNEAGLCEFCMGLLDDRENQMANRWMTGQGP